MYYKNDYNLPNQEYINSHPLEFALVLSKKMKYFPNYETGLLMLEDTQGKLSEYSPVFFNSENSTYFVKDGKRRLSDYGKKNILNSSEGMLDVHFYPLDLTKRNYNKEVLLKIEKILEDFCILEVSKKIKDKDGNIYQMKIFNNADATIGDCLIADQLILTKNDKIIGHLMVKYTTTTILNKLEAKNDFFLNKATIDYSYLDPDMRGRRLGLQMYFHMAQHLNKKGIEFRKSTLQSNEAQKLWASIEKKWQDHTYTKKIKNETHIFLNMTQDLQFYFLKNQSVIRSKRKKIS